MIKKIAAVLFTLISFCGFSQVNHEFGIFTGTSNYQGDLSLKQVTVKSTHGAIGLMYQYNFSHYLGLRIAGNYGTVSGGDSLYSTNRDRYKRNLSFSSPIIEGALQLEFNLRPFDPGYTEDDINFTPFFAIGVGFFHFNPQATLNGTTYKLQKLPTELNKPAYSLNQLSVPLNIGVKYTLTDAISLRVEYGYRKTTTDYIDDVSDKYSDFDAVMAANPTDPNIAYLTDRGRLLGPEFNYQKQNDPNNPINRGDPRNKDNYLFAGISITYCFNKNHGIINHYAPPFDPFHRRYHHR